MDPRIQKAKQAGYSDAEIQAYIAKKQAVPQSDPIPGIVKAGVPVVTGGLGAAVGSVGGPLGSAGMGALGAMGGQALINLLERSMGGPVPNSIPENMKSLRNAGGAQLAGEGMGKIMGFAANPIKALGSHVDDVLSNSTKGINLYELFNKFKNNLPSTVGKMAGKGPETEAAITELYKRLSQMVHARVPQEGAIQDVTVSTANEIKRAIPKLGNLLGSPTNGTTIADMYGSVSSPGFEVPKIFNNMLKDTIEEAVPGVKIPNKLMHLLYQVPDALAGLSHVLGPQAGRTARNIGGAVAGIPGKIIPEGGGLLKYLLQLGLQSGQQSTQKN